MILQCTNFCGYDMSSKFLQIRLERNSQNSVGKEDTASGRVDGGPLSVERAVRAIKRSGKVFDGDNRNEDPAGEMQSERFSQGAHLKTR